MTISHGSDVDLYIRINLTLTILAHLTSLQNESAKANRQDLIAEANQRRDSQRNLAKLERKRKQVEAMGEKQDALETGEDLERKRAWDYSIEDNEKWDKKLARKGRRGDFSFTGKRCAKAQLRYMPCPTPADNPRRTQITTTSPGESIRR